MKAYGITKLTAKLKNDNRQYRSKIFTLLLVFVSCCSCEIYRTAKYSPLLGVGKGISTFRSQHCCFRERKVHRENFRSMEHLLLGTFALVVILFLASERSKNFCSLELSFLWNFCSLSLHRTSDVDTRRRLRSADSAMLVVPSTRRSTLGDRAFPVASARAWNSLPSSVRNAPSLTTFHHELKTVLFRSSFDND